MRTPLLSLATLLLLSSSCTLLHAQSKIVPAPDAVELRKVWEKKGRDLRVDEYGTAMWGGIDISGDGIADFGVYQNVGNYPDTWHFYRGADAPDTALLWRFDSVASQLAFGNFFGDDTLYILFRDGSMELIDDFAHYFDRLRLYRLTDTGVVHPPRLSVYQGEQNPPIERTIRGISSADVNNDNIPDLSLILSGIRVGLDPNNYDSRAQIWIYLGGPDFQLDSPSVVIYDTLLDGTPPDAFWTAHFRDFDGDGYVDILTAGEYPGFGSLVRFRWGDQLSPASWTSRPFDRDIPIHNDSSGLRGLTYAPYYQIDSDPGLDFVGIIKNEDLTATAYLYLSRSESVRTRSFRLDNADSVFLLPRNFSYGRSSAYLNDSLRRFEMLPFDRPKFFNEPGGLIFLSGGANGPDADYDAVINESLNGWRIGDVTGDGWEDYGASNPEAGTRATGIAVVYAGGPYIPLDDPTLNVREEPVAGEAGGLFLWPNPVVDELNIAWRGNLRQMPARFEVYDVRGVLIAEGEVEPGRGKALWKCTDAPSGMFILQVFDADNHSIATAEVVKR